MIDVEMGRGEGGGSGEGSGERGGMQEVACVVHHAQRETISTEK